MVPEFWKFLYKWALTISPTRGKIQVCGMGGLDRATFYHGVRLKFGHFKHFFTVLQLWTHISPSSDQALLNFYSYYLIPYSWVVSVLSELSTIHVFRNMLQVPRAESWELSHRARPFADNPSVMSDQTIPAARATADSPHVYGLYCTAAEQKLNSSHPPRWTLDRSLHACYLFGIGV